MATRGLIIAIEKYGHSYSLARELPGTNADADLFRQWLIEKKQVTPADIFCCAGPECAWRTTGPTRPEIIETLAQLVTTGQDKTEELYVFFSGHGFAYDEAWAQRRDVLVAANFVDLDSSGDACLKLQEEIQPRLASALGPGVHYYFVDACRTAVAEGDIQVLGLGRKFSKSQLGLPSWYTIYSTRQGQAARVNSGFTRSLVDGLSGIGRAKGWRGPKMYVIFDLLCEFLQQKIKTQKVDSDRRGNGNGGLILELSPVPKYACTVRVENASPTDSFELKIRDIKENTRKVPFIGAEYTLELLPDDYYCELAQVVPPTSTSRLSDSIIQVAPPAKFPLDLYEPCTVAFELQRSRGEEDRAGDALGVPIERNEESTSRSRGGGDIFSNEDSIFDRGRVADESFSKPPRGRGGEATSHRVTTTAPISTKASLVLKAAPGTTIHLEHLQTGFRVDSVEQLDTEVLAGKYRIELRERGMMIDERIITLTPGEKVDLDLLAHPQDEIRTRILSHVSGIATARVAEFSESLGPIANWSLGLWLALLGSSRILGPIGQFEKLSRLPLESFADVTPGESSVYVLAALEKSTTGLQVALSQRDTALQWNPAREVPEFKGIAEWRRPAAPGAHLLSVVFPGTVPLTYAVHSLPNRVTFLTVVEDESGQITMHQYLLPIYTLFSQLPQPVVDYFMYNPPLTLIRSLFIAQHRFARNLSIEPEVTEDTQAKQDWDALIYGKWLDPIMSLIAAYDIVRRGLRSRYKDVLTEMIGNLRTYFDGIPDIEAIAKLAGLLYSVPQTPPLIFDGVLAFEEKDEGRLLPLSADRLDLSSPWTTWRGAVS